MPIFSLVLCATERPIYTIERLTASGVMRTKVWGDEIIARPKVQLTGHASLSRKEVARSALSEATCDQLGNCYVPHNGNMQSLSARVANLRDTGEFEWVMPSPVLSARQAPSEYQYASAQWYLRDPLPGAIQWRERARRVLADNTYFIPFDTGICVGHESFDWERNEKTLNFNATTLDPRQTASVFDGNGHGCATSSLVLSVKNIVGLAGGVKFGVFKVLDPKGNADTKAVVSAILELVERKKNFPPVARFVVLMAFGSTEQIPAIDEAIQIAQKSGIIFVVAAGNDGINADRFPQTPTTTPGVISVGACGFQAEMIIRSNWASTYGQKTVTTCAPGDRIIVAVPRPQEGVYTYEMVDPRGYMFAEGTSFSAAIVAGLVIQALIDFPEETSEQVLARVMNGNRQMTPVTIWKRLYHGTDLFRSGSVISWNSLDPRQEEFQVPTLQVRPGHSSVKIELGGFGSNGTTIPFGIRCRYGSISDTRTWEATPFFGGEIILAGPDGAPLPEGTPTQLACQVSNGAGRWSPYSEAVSFSTLKSREEEIALSSLTLGDGPLMDLIRETNPNARPLWNLTPIFGALGKGVALYAGRPEMVDYSRVGNNDSVAETPEITLSQGAVSIWMKKYIQMFGILPQGLHYDSAEISVSYVENREEREEVLTTLLPTNRSFGPEDVGFDLTKFSGKTVKLRFRFFTNGTSVGIGWVIFDLILRYDE